MLYTTENMRAVASTDSVVDRSIIYTDNKNVQWIVGVENGDGTTGHNMIELDYVPKGNIISLTIIKDGETLVVDGTPNRVGRVISFLYGDNLGGCSAEVKYLIG